jgi:hypothetical protein
MVAGSSSCCCIFKKPFVFSDTGAQMGMQPLLLTAVRELEGVERQKA